jgi:PAS domain-containing protein
MSDRTEQLVTSFCCARQIGFAVLDRQLRYRALNTSLANINGMPEESHLGITIGDIFGDLARRVAEPHYNHVLATGATASFEVEDAALPNRPEAARYWGLNFNFPIRNHAGGITHIGVLVVEVTEQRQLQRFLRELEGKLRGSKSEDGFWFGRKIHDCLDQYDVALKASFDVLVRNPAASLEQLVCSIEALEQRLCILRQVVSQVAGSLPTDGPLPPKITLLSATIRKHL